MNDLVAGVITFFARDPWPITRDLVDIGLVAILIYWVLSLLKGTRAMQMAVGLALIFAIYQLAQRFGLVTVSTILDSMITYIVLIVVVIFQSDIRRALMRVGRRPLFRGARTARETQVIEEVIKAAMSLAQKRLGALIVFERDAELDEFVERGTDLDAEVSKELLYSIFIPSFENPMHDGAVVIREGRIWQAGTFLPLASTSRQDRTLGARHRAALGISQETDAVVVVVSEERGAVSLCFNGNLVRNLDANSLRDGLHGLFYRSAPEARPRERRPSLDVSSDGLIPPKVSGSSVGIDDAEETKG
ncbi:MAG: TIGR00159 family protein [Deltaproteobacteria bacterium]|nr:TIGR00159 family protein [Deltaproteobacteria bacterium]